MNINEELRKELLEFLNKVLVQSYSSNEWEKYAINHYQNNQLESIRKEAVYAIKKFSPGGVKRPFSDEMKTIIQKLINELEEISI